jgi:septal ring factor EnvC (AmiA/AmiB activator)
VPRAAIPAILALLVWALAGPAGWLPQAAGQEGRDAAAADAPAEGQSLDQIERAAQRSRTAAEELSDKAARLAEEIRAIKGKSVTVARRTQQLESELSGIEDTLAALEEERTEKAAALAERRGQLVETLSALQRIAVQPPAALAVAPGSPLEIVRSAALLEVAVPEIERRAAALKADLADLRALRGEIERQRRQLRDTAAALAQERQQLERLTARKAKLRDRAAARSQAARSDAARLADEASDMRDLVAGLRAQAERRARARERVPIPATKPPPGARNAAPDPASAPETASAEGGDSAAAHTGNPRRTARVAPADAATAGAGDGGTPRPQRARLTKPADIRAFPDSRASLTLPARGRLVTRYGDRIARAGGSVRAKGIELATRTGAQVVAPYDGQVVYAGPFRSYGRILIIEHGGRYHSLLAGLERIDAVVGQWVLAGEPVGLMDRSGTSDPKLYLELRRGGQPINPLPWLAQTGDKVRG